MRRRNWVAVFLFTVILARQLAAGEDGRGLPAARPRWKHLTSQRGELPVPPAGNQQTGTIVADFDRDGRCDFMLTERTKAPSVVWYRPQATGWAVYVVDGDRLPLEAGGTSCDVDGDGDADLLAGEDGSGRNVYWWENPSPRFDPAKPWTRRAVKNSGANKHHDLITGDFLGTGKPQLVFWNPGACISPKFPPIRGAPSLGPEWRSIAGNPVGSTRGLLRPISMATARRTSSALAGGSSTAGPIGSSP